MPVEFRERAATKGALVASALALLRSVSVECAVLGGMLVATYVREPGEAAVVDDERPARWEGHKYDAPESDETRRGKDTANIVFGNPATVRGVGAGFPVVLGARS